MEKLFDLGRKPPKTNAQADFEVLTLRKLKTLTTPPLSRFRQNQANPAKLRSNAERRWSHRWHHHRRGHRLAEREINCGKAPKVEPHGSLCFVTIDTMASPEQAREQRRSANSNSRRERGAWGKLGVLCSPLVVRRRFPFCIATNLNSRNPRAASVQVTKTHESLSQVRSDLSTSIALFPPAFTYAVSWITLICIFMIPKLGRLQFCQVWCVNSACVLYCYDWLSYLIEKRYLKC